MSEDGERPVNPVVVAMRLSRPSDGEFDEWIINESEMYAEAAKYMSYYIEERAKMGDRSTAELFEEFKNNVCMFMRSGYDVLGEQ